MVAKVTHKTPIFKTFQLHFLDFFLNLLLLLVTHLVYKIMNSLKKTCINNINFYTQCFVTSVLNYKNSFF